MTSEYLTRIHAKSQSAFNRLRLIDKTVDQAESHAARILSIFVSAMVDANRLATSSSHSLAIAAVMNVRDIADAAFNHRIRDIASPVAKAARYDESRWHYAYVTLVDAVARSVADFAGDWCQDSCPVCYSLSEAMATVSAASELSLDLTSMAIGSERVEDIPPHEHEVFPIIEKSIDTAYWSATCVVCSGISMHRIDDMYGAVTSGIIHVSEVKRLMAEGKPLDM